MAKDRGFNDTPICSKSPDRTYDRPEITTYDLSTVRRTISFQDDGGKMQPFWPPLAGTLLEVGYSDLPSGRPRVSDKSRWQVLV